MNTKKYSVFVRTILLYHLTRPPSSPYLQSKNDTNENRNLYMQGMYNMIALCAIALTGNKIVGG